MWDFLWHKVRRLLVLWASSQPNEEGLRTPHGLPQHSVLRAPGWAATGNLIQQNNGAPDKLTDSSCHRQTLRKEDTTDTLILLWGTHLPAPCPPT